MKMLPQNLGKFRVIERKNIKVCLITHEGVIQGWHFDKNKLKQFVDDNKIKGDIVNKKVSPSFMGYIAVNYQMLPAPQC